MLCLVESSSSSIFGYTDECCCLRKARLPQRVPRQRAHSHAVRSIKAGAAPPAPMKRRTMDMFEVVGFGFMSLVWVAFVVVTARIAVLT
jgi:hypothetical protein